MKIAQLTCLLLILNSAFCIFTLPLCALPVQVPYSGQLADNGELVNSNRIMRFEILDASSAVRYDSGPITVPVTNGIFRVLLGGTNQALLDSATFAEPGRRLRITVGSTVLTPNQEIHYTPYAAHALMASNAVASLQASNANMANSAVTALVASNAITALQASNAVYALYATSATNSLQANSANNAVQAANANQLGGVLAQNYARLDQTSTQSFLGPLTAGTVTASTFVGSGSGLVDLNASQLSGGTVPDGRLPSTLARLNQANTWSAAQSFSGGAAFGGDVSISTGTVLLGLGTSLRVRGALELPTTGISGAGMGSGLDADLLDGVSSEQFARLNAPNVFSSAATFQGSVRLTQPLEGDLTVAGAVAASSLSGNGAALTGLNATALTGGTVSPARGGTGLDTSAALPGSLLRALTPGTWQTLPAGTEGQVLKMSGGLPAWGTDNAGTSSGGTVTTITAGTGLSLSPNPITTSGTISLDNTIVPLKNTPNTFSEPQTFQGSGPLILEGATVDANKTTLSVAEPTAPRTLTLPDASGTLGIVSAGTGGGSSTPSVRGRTALVLGGYTGSTTIADLVEGVDGQIVVLIGVTTNTPRIDSGGNFRLRSLELQWVAQPNHTLTLVRANGLWFEMARSQN